MQTSDFLDSIGINTRLSFTSSQYYKAGQALEALTYLGIDQVRDLSVRPATPNLGAYSLFANAGIRFDMVVQAPDNLAKTLSAVEQFALQQPGAINALEGPNEINLGKFAYGALSGKAAGSAYMADMLRLTGKSEVLKDIASYSLTGYNLDDGSDYANFHDYIYQGNQPFAGLSVNPLSKGLVPDKPIVLTETGYATTSAPGGAWEGVDEATQAKLTLNLLFDAQLASVSKVYLYQLLDAYADPTGKSIDRNLGLFDLDFRPKAAAVAIHNLTALLKAETGHFSGESLAYRVSNLPSDGHSLLLEKPGGVRDIILWAEPDIWDQQTDSAIAVAPTDALIDFGTTRVSVRVYDPLVGKDPVASFDDVTAVRVGVADHPVIVEVADVGGFKDGPLAEPGRVILGKGKADDLSGTSGNDFIRALGGADTVDGRAGDDILWGGGKGDRLAGGSGADTFVYNDVLDSQARGGKLDVILDFARADGDIIKLAPIDANERKAGDQAFFLTGDHFTRHAGELIQYARAGGMMIEGDVNGDGAADLAIFLEGVSAPLGAEAFLL